MHAGAELERYVEALTRLKSAADPRELVASLLNRPSELVVATAGGVFVAALAAKTKLTFSARPPPWFPGGKIHVTVGIPVH